MDSLRFNLLQYMPNSVYAFYKTPLSKKIRTIAESIFAIILGAGLPTFLVISSRAVCKATRIREDYFGFFLMGVSIFIWLHPAKRGINFDFLKNYSITKKKLQNYENEINNDKDSICGEFSKLIELICNDESYIYVFKKGNLFPVFLELLIKLIKKVNLSEEVCRKLYLRLVMACVFDEQTQETKFVCRNNEKVKMSKIALLLASPNLRTLYSSNSQDSNLQIIELQRKPSTAAVQLLKETIYSNKLEVRSRLSFDDISDFLFLYEMHEFPEPKRARHQLLTQITPAIKTENILEKRFQVIDESEQRIGHNLTEELRYYAMSSFFQHAYKDSTPFYLEDNRFTIPLDALYLLENEGRLGIYLRERVNCISLPPLMSTVDPGKVRLNSHANKISALVFQLGCKSIEIKDSKNGCHILPQWQFSFNSFDQLLKLLPVTVLYTSVIKVPKEKIQNSSKYKLPENLHVIPVSAIQQFHTDYKRPIRVLFNADLQNVHISGFHDTSNFFKAVKFVNLMRTAVFWDFNFDVENESIESVEAAFNDNHQEHGLKCHFALDKKDNIHKATFTPLVYL